MRSTNFHLALFSRRSYLGSETVLAFFLQKVLVLLVGWGALPSSPASWVCALWISHFLRFLSHHIKSTVIAPHRLSLTVVFSIAPALHPHYRPQRRSCPPVRTQKHPGVGLVQSDRECVRVCVCACVRACVCVCV